MSAVLLVLGFILIEWPQFKSDEYEEEAISGATIAHAIVIDEKTLSE